MVRMTGWNNRTTRGAGARVTALLWCSSLLEGARDEISIVRRRIRSLPRGLQQGTDGRAQERDRQSGLERRGPVRRNDQRFDDRTWAVAVQGRGSRNEHPRHAGAICRQDEAE